MVVADYTGHLKVRLKFSLLPELGDATSVRDKSCDGYGVVCVARITGKISFKPSTRKEDSTFYAIADSSSLVAIPPVIRYFSTFSCMKAVIEDEDVSQFAFPALFGDVILLRAGDAEDGTIDCSITLQDPTGHFVLLLQDCPVDEEWKYGEGETVLLVTVFLRLGTTVIGSDIIPMAWQ